MLKKPEPKQPEPKPDDWDRYGAVEPLTVVTEVPQPLKRVKVVAPFRVVYETIAYSGGDLAEVPADVAESWLRNSWCEPA
jgi:hypothetical protein